MVRFYTHKPQSQLVEKWSQAITSQGESSKLTDVLFNYVIFLTKEREKEYLKMGRTTVFFDRYIIQSISHTEPITASVSHTQHQDKLWIGTKI